MSQITMTTTLGEIEGILGRDQFGGYLMECRASTQERMQNTCLDDLASFAGPIQGARALRGVQLLERLVGEGREVARPLYSADEVASDPTKAVSRLFFMPGEAGAPFVVVVPGGSYQSVCSYQEGFPTAADLVEAGYNVFLLTYRTRMEEQSAKPISLAIEDLAHAVRHILDNTAAYQVAPRYAVWGWSAGGHLTAEWGTDNWGAANWDLQPADMLMLGYPAIDFHTLIASAEDAEKDKFFASVLGAKEPDMANVDEFAIERHLGEAYPATFIWQCKDDEVVPYVNFRLMDAALDEAGVRHQSVSYSAGGHGLLHPHGAEADGWTTTAIAFLNAVMGR